MQTISDYYSQDVPTDAVHVLEYPTTCKKLVDNRFLRNATKWLIDDEYKVPNYENFRCEIPLRTMAAFGDKGRVYAVVRPDARLEQHWDRKLGSRGQLRYADLAEDAAPHVVFFPLEDLPRELHAVDPDAHYLVHSKAYIPTIACPQAAVQDALRLPAVLKACRAAGTEGTWMIHSREDYAARVEWLERNMPYADTILTDMVQNIVSQYCCQVYITKSGEMQWVGATDNGFDEDGFWSGGTVNMGSQESVRKRYEPALLPVAEALHQTGYFGWCGIDVLEDAKGGLYVVDINPRICASTGLLLAAKLMETRGWSWGLLSTGITLDSSLDEVLSTAEKMTERGEVLVLSAIATRGKTQCQVAFYSDSRQACSALAKDFKRCVPEALVIR